MYDVRCDEELKWQRIAIKLFYDAIIVFVIYVCNYKSLYFGLVCNTTLSA